MPKRADDVRRVPSTEGRLPELLLQFTKRTDGGSVLRCVRADGSVTWQRLDGRQGAFFPLHDLTHYAVETELRFRAGFYGLIATGWDIDDTTGKGTRGGLPDETVVVEHLVGSFSAEAAGGIPWTADAFNEQAAAFAANRGRPAPRVLSAEELAHVRSRIRELFLQWDAVPLGGTLELPFERPPE
jgi:hypothetical protein